MRVINFRPLRFNKKTNKIIVASYMQWNKLRCANYSKFNLIIISDYDKMNKEDFVYNHEGKQLYHFNYNPWDVHVHHGSCIADGFSWDEMRKIYKDFILTSSYTSYHMRGVDSGGTPTFSHYDEDYVTSDDTWNYYGADAFEPVTVGYILIWLGWFLYQLENSQIKVS